MVSPRAVPDTRQLPSFCITQREALRCTLAWSNEPGSGNKAIVAVKWNSHYVLGNGSSLEITCFLIELRNVFILSQVAYYLWVQCVIIKITYLGKNNEQKVSWKNTTQQAYIFLERWSSILSTIVLCFTVVNPHRKQQNASDVFACTKRPCLKAQPLGTCHKAPHLWALYTHLFTDFSQSVPKQRYWWREQPKKLHPSHDSAAFVLSRASSQSSIKGPAKIAPNFLPHLSVPSTGTVTIDIWGGSGGGGGKQCFAFIHF